MLAATVLANACLQRILGGWTCRSFLNCIYSGNQTECCVNLLRRRQLKIGYVLKIGNKKDERWHLGFSRCAPTSWAEGGKPSILVGAWNSGAMISREMEGREGMGSRKWWKVESWEEMSQRWTEQWECELIPPPLLPQADEMKSKRKTYVKTYPAGEKLETAR